MLTLSGSLRIFLALEPCDMRKSFDSLDALVVSNSARIPVAARSSPSPTAPAR